MYFLHLKNLLAHVGGQTHAHMVLGKLNIIGQHAAGLQMIILHQIITATTAVTTVHCHLITTTVAVF